MHFGPLAEARGCQARTQPELSHSGCSIALSFTVIRVCQYEQHGGQALAWPGIFEVRHIHPVLVNPRNGAQCLLYGVTVGLISGDRLSTR